MITTPTLGTNDGTKMTKVEDKANRIPAVENIFHSTTSTVRSPVTITVWDREINRVLKRKSRSIIDIRKAHMMNLNIMMGIKRRV